MTAVPIPNPARIPRLQSAVILNAVKDLRLYLVSQNQRRVAMSGE
jgi:hypothetical protein